jgi:hypothetical protein
MSSPKVESIRGSVHTAFSLAHLLERIERSGQPINADHYRTVVSKLKAALSDALPDVALTALLRTYPSAAEIHGNLNYEQAGFCHSWLESQVPSEVLAAHAMKRWMRRRG